MPSMKPLLTPQQYLECERKAKYKSEYYRGEMFAMAGASWEQTLIKDNVAHEARNRLGDGPCRVLTSDVRVLVDATGLYTYPDVIVVCEKPLFEDKRFDTLLNPRCLVEVLSSSTEKYDRGEKFADYQKVASLQEYILIAQDQPLVERHVRQPDGSWLMTAFSEMTQSFEFASLPVTIALADIYRGVEFSENTRR